MSFNWTCPYCNREQVVVAGNFIRNHTHFELPSKRGSSVGLSSVVIRCANDECMDLTVRVYLGVDKAVGAQSVGVWGFDTKSRFLFDRRILPEGGAKALPDYIPAPLREDYYEASQIAELSPKAAATLARRCLQGMVRDFGRVRPSTLYKEIEDLERGVALGTTPRDVSADSIMAIARVRNISNIAACMKMDVNSLAPADAREARMLINLVEALFDEWYVARHKRTQRFAALAEGPADKEPAAIVETAKIAAAI